MKKILFVISLMVLNSGFSAEDTKLLELRSSDTVPVFIELYTSQGCSSCPPADRYLNSLRSNVGLFRDFIPMAFHVDYWDYLGWNDPFASKANSNRQRSYKAINKSNSVYTPQFIVNDQEWRGFFKRRPATTKSNYKNPNTLTVEFDGEVLTADYSADNTELLLHTAILGIGTKTKVPRGENAGKILEQDFVVLSHQIMRSDSNQWSMKISLPTAKADKLALVGWITARNDSKPLQAVAAYLPNTFSSNSE